MPAYKVIEGRNDPLFALTVREVVPLLVVNEDIAGAVLNVLDGATLIDALSDREDLLGRVGDHRMTAASVVAHAGTFSVEAGDLELEVALASD